MEKLRVSWEYDNEMGVNKKLYSFTNKKTFTAIDSFNEDVIEEAFNFAWGMSFGDDGEHRNHRTGGTHKRRNGETFADTFQGKLAEFAIYQVFTNNEIDTPRPDTEMYGLGEWDSSDFDIKGVKIAVKSTKSFGQLLLLESDDWNDQGLYIPNLDSGNSAYHAFILVRLTPFVSDLLKKRRWLFKDSLEKDELKQVVMNESFLYDIPGCVSRKMLIKAIKDGMLIPKGSYLGKTFETNKMDADNFYIQTGDMLDIGTLIKFIHSK